MSEPFEAKKIYSATIVGLGRIASLLEDDRKREKPATHAGAISVYPRITLEGGCDGEEERRRCFAERWNVPTVTPSIDELLLQTNPDILVIATYPDSHEFFLRKAVARQIPLVICEKPLAHTLRSARRMMGIISGSGHTRVIVNHERRYSRDYRIVREAVRKELLGELLSVSGTLHFSLHRPLDRVLHHDGTHMVDAINFITSDRFTVKHRSASLRSRAPTVFLEGILETSRVPVSIHVGTRRDYLHFSIDLSFSRGRIEIGNGIFRWEVSKGSPYYDGYKSLVDMERRRPEPSGYFTDMVEDAVLCLDDPRRKPTSSIEDALAVMYVIRRATRRI